jgi:hypothetical protein
MIKPKPKEIERVLKQHVLWLRTRFFVKKAEGERANFCGANLAEAHLEEANLAEAHLEEANLIEAHLEKANLTSANVKAVVFEIQPKTLPLIPTLATTQNLATMTYSRAPHALVELRNALKEAGMRQQEREIAYALEHTKRLKKEKAAKEYEENDPEKLGEGKIVDWGMYLEARANYYLFEFTSEWGMSPGKPLQIILMLIPGFGLLYMMAVVPHPMVKEAGVWKVLPEDNLQEIKGKDRFTRVEASSFPIILLWGLYVSVLSTFHIGWRDLNVGTWISRLQPSAFTIQAVGWVRVVSGVQSLISLYLLALSVLTYFGRPFE